MRKFAILICIAASGLPGIVRADDVIVYSPYVFASKNEIEVRGYQMVDARAGMGGSAAELAVSHGVNDWWKPEFYVAKYQHTQGSLGRLQGYEFENTFQLTPTGKYWADFGLLASFEHMTIANTPNVVEFGPLIERTSGRFTHIANFIWEKEVGAGASGHYAYRYTYSGTYTVSQAFRPGIEAYGRPADHAYQAGPIVGGEWHVPGTNGHLEYRVGMVHGINSSAPHQTWLAQLEYEFF